WPMKLTSPHRRRAALAAGGLALALGVPGAQASNTGFKLNLELQAHPFDLGTNRVSFPYFYFPDGQVGMPESADDLRNDFPDATSFARIVPATGRVESWDDLLGTWMGTDFPLEEAVGCSVAVPADGKAAVVGSMDDSFSGLLLEAPGGAITTHLVAP